jgi:cytochrome bd-type quinol oxidase subunit 2
MHSVYKIILVIVLLVVIFELFQALYFMIRDKGESGRTVWALTRRIGLSVILFGMIVLGIWMGWLNPHAVIH